MTTQEQRQKFRDSDALILKALEVSYDVRANSCEIPAEMMPNGQVLTIYLDGIQEIDNSVRKQLVDIVRREYDAREAKKNAQERGDADSHEGSSERGDKGSADSRRGRVAGQSNPEASEETLEQVLEGQVLRLTSAVETLESQHAETMKTLHELVNRLVRTKQDLKIAKETLERFNAPKDEPQDSDEHSSDESKGGIEADAGVDRPEVPSD